MDQVSWCLIGSTWLVSQCAYAPACDSWWLSVPMHVRVRVYVCVRA